MSSDFHNLYSKPFSKDHIHKGWGNNTIIFNPGGNDKPTIWFWDMFGDGVIIFQFYNSCSWRVRFLTKLLFGSVWTKNNGP